MENCFNCKHLEWVEAEAHDPNGYCCHKRQYKNEDEELDHQAKLEDDSYLKSVKKCCDPKENKVGDL